jgi:Leucine-rich repeat (LRR) protein
MDDEDGALNNADEEDRASKRTKREVLTELRLQRRQAEFSGSINILCQPQNAPSLQNLVSLSLYDCQIHTLDGIGMLGGINDNETIAQPAVCPHLSELNLGRNPLKSLPDELSALSPSLKELWLDDCQLSGELPVCLMKLENLEVLRVSNNKITSIPSDIRRLEYLRVLCLDRNEIEHVPTELSELSNLESLMLR